jgi:hypothetical protein
MHRPVQLKEDQVVVQHLQAVHQPAKAVGQREAETETLIQTLAAAAAEQVQMDLVTTVEQIRVTVELDYKVPLLEPQYITQAVAVARHQAAAVLVRAMPAAAVLAVLAKTVLSLFVMPIR